MTFIGPWFDIPGWQTGKWKSLVRTKLCQKCIFDLKRKCNDTVFEEDAEKSVEVKRPKNECNISKDETIQSTADVPLPTNNSLDLIQNFEDYNYQSSEVCQANVNEMQSTNFIIYNEPQNNALPYPEITWIRYIVDENPTLNSQYTETGYLPYFFPTTDYLLGICNCHSIPFYKYPFDGCITNPNILDKTNLLTVKFLSQNENSSGFQALSYLLTGNENSFGIFRNLIHFYIQQKVLPQKFCKL
uniref:Uncharacterized protein n=1 Tax=Panagrolaimus sp. ES5 TaxID=591445 RepID=A0AC34FIF4_9BILA